MLALETKGAPRQVASLLGILEFLPRIAMVAAGSPVGTPGLLPIAGLAVSRLFG
jgi:hypothetical protein